jgi:hypothetical protein
MGKAGLRSPSDFASSHMLGEGADGVAVELRSPLVSPLWANATTLAAFRGDSRRLAASGPGDDARKHSADTCNFVTDEASRFERQTLVSCYR